MSEEQERTYSKSRLVVEWEAVPVPARREYTRLPDKRRVVKCRLQGNALIEHILIGPHKRACRQFDLDAALHVVTLNDVAGRADEGVFPRISAHSRVRAMDLLNF